MIKSEQQLQKQISSWLQIQFPTVYFMSDASGIPMSSWGLKKLLKQTRSCHAALDLVILEKNKEFNALIIELKSKTPFQKNGDIKNDAHLLEQLKSMSHLSGQGYATTWCWTFEMAQKIIIEYLNNR